MPTESRHRPGRSLPAVTLRVLGAAALIGVSAVHLQQYGGNGYSHIPTIGTLFLLNGIGGGIVALALLAPIPVLRRIDPLLALGGIAIAVGALVGLFVSESTLLFGFMETGYRTAIVLAIAFEAATAVLLAAFVAVRLRGRAGRARGMTVGPPTTAY